MESNFSNRDFEQFVKQNADQYRMFPSEKVWKGINNALHTRRKWYGFWLSMLLLVTGGAVTWVMMAYPSSKKQDQTSQTGTPISEKNTPAVVASNSSSQTIENLLPFSKQTLAFQQTQPVIKDLTITESLLPSITDELSTEITAIRHLTETTVTEKQFTPITSDLAVSGKINIPAELSTHLNSAEKSDIDSEKYPATSDDGQSRLSVSVFYPFTIESVINSYKFKKAPRKLSWQLFVTPTVSYRKLSVNKSYDNPSGSVYPFASPSSDVNSAVTHKPDLGLQIGLSARYPITKNIKIRGGLQFNINRYDIKAYQFNGEVATIDLNGGPGNNTISTWTYYRNYNGYKSDWLKNYYFSVSAPIGAEIKLLGNTKTNIGIAGTLQPTYILNDRAYLISTDFKNYAEVPRLIRHVNLNTSFETFVNYTSGKTKWQIGPQVRYQILSSFQNKYPVKENLFDFGLKIGVTLSE